MKKLCCIVIAISVIFCCLCVPAFSASDMRLTDAVYPTEYVCGKTFSVYGIITSSHNIMTVEISVADSAGNVEFSYTGRPGEKTYNIHNVDYLLPFSKLEEGSYVYKIVAADTQESGVVLLSKNFKVVSDGTSDTLKLSSEIAPTSIRQGSTFSIGGTVTSDYPISEITCAVYSANGTLQFTKTVYPDTKSYSLSNVDKYMTFSKLTAGSYTYKITASDSKSKNVVLFSKDFTVTSTSGSTLKLENETYPSSLSKGSSFSIYGTVTSDYEITAVTIGAYTLDGTAKFEYTAKPWEKSYNIHNVDYLMTFSKLQAGSYIYRITASDTETKNIVLLEKNFTVTESQSAESGLKRVNWDVIDVSYHDEIVSWDKIAAAVDGVIIRVGYRSKVGSRAIGNDVKFAEFYKEAKSRGLHVGCYFYSNALTTSEAEQEAEFVLKKIKENNCVFDMPVYYDMETEAQVALSQANCTKIARTFCDIITANGYYTGIYCNKYFARDELYASQLSDITFWIAQYASACTYDGPYGIWQYSETGSVSGIKGNVDLDYCYYDYPSYIVSNGLSGNSAATPKFEIKKADKLRIDESAKIISGVESGFTVEDFKKKYIERTSNVSVEFGNTVDGKIATGTTVTFTSGGKKLAAYTVSVIGDIDGNGTANSADALLALECSIGRKTLSGLKKLSADVTEDGIINSADALEILERSVKS